VSSQLEDARREWSADRDARSALRRQTTACGVRESVEAAVHLLEHSAVTKPLEVRPRNPSVVQVPRAHRALSGEAKKRSGSG
jgi:hypothetical protein